MKTLMRNKKSMLLMSALAIAVLVGGYSIQKVIGADHIDASLTVADQNADINDLYAFTRGDNLVLVMTVFPFAETTSRLNPDYLYQFKIDNTGDNVEDQVIQVRANEAGSDQRISVYGPIAPETTGPLNNSIAGGDAVRVRFGDSNTSDNVDVFVGLRDDPFFFDLGRFREIIADVAAGNVPPIGFNNPGTDALAGANTIAIVVEFPKAMVSGASGNVGIWATASLINN